MFSDKQLTAVEATISKLGADGRSKGEVVASFAGHWDGAIAQTAGAAVAPLLAGCGGAAAAALAAAGAPFLDVTKLAVAPKWASSAAQRSAAQRSAAQRRDALQRESRVCARTSMHLACCGLAQPTEAPPRACACGCTPVSSRPSPAPLSLFAHPLFARSLAHPLSLARIFPFSFFFRALQVLPLAEQGPWESRRLWQFATAELLKASARARARERAGRCGRATAAR